MWRVDVDSSSTGDAGGPGADHQGTGHEAGLPRPAEEQTAQSELLGDPASPPDGENEPGRFPVSTNHVRLCLKQAFDACVHSYQTLTI